MEQKEKEDLAGRLKTRRYRKYILTVLAVFVCVSAIAGLRIEGRNAKLPDGRGNIVTGQQEEIQQEEMQREEMEQEASAEKEKSEDGHSGKIRKNKSEAEAKAEKQNEKISKLTDEEKEKIDSSEIKVDNKEDFTASNGGNAPLRPQKAKPVTVTLSIRCDTLSSDMSKLENPAIKDYISADGVILPPSTYNGTTDNSVFDALNTLCRNNDIQLDFSFTPVYDSYYVKGLNYLYEFDGGSLSGWMYKVNGWFPNYGCSSYYLSDGDVIEWVYTCDMGKDVGNDSVS